MCIMLGYSFFSRMELLFLGYYERNGDAAKYQLLLRIADLVILPDFLFNYFLPQQFSHLFAKKDKEGAEKLFRNAARTIFLLQLICLAGISVLGYFYLQSFNIAGADMLILLVVLGSAQLFYSLFGSTNLVLMTSGHERFSFIALGMVIIVEAIANLLFIAPYGLKAAVYISWGSVLVYTVILFYFVHKKLHFGSPLIALSKK
jgi:O-antigen/teichoic acid export membrane protein